MKDPRAAWRTQTTEPWLAVGQQVRDEWGDWTIDRLPDDDAPYGYAQVEIVDSTPVYRASRHVYLNEFLRDFRPID